MQQPMNHQMMGYDRAITMFSPDGRLLQVEYARKMVRQGSTAIGIVYKNGVLLVTDKRLVDKLVVPESVEKIWPIDTHIAATASGMVSDARVLFERSQLKAQQHRVTYDSPMDVLGVVRDICNLKQICTQSGGLRPFGVSTLIIGVDEIGSQLFETDPAGIYFRYHAKAIGEGEVDAEEYLYKHFTHGMSRDEAVRLAVQTLFTVIGKSITGDRLDAVYIEDPDAGMQKIDDIQLDKVLKESKKKK
jgi:proteasome alpha subunit